MEKIKISFCYDGTHYHGWQRQKNTSSTIQEVLETKLSQIVSDRVSVVASGRTDAGVHARIQVAHSNIRKPFECKKLQNSLNSILPPDIRIWKIEKVDLDFHSSRDVKEKTYVYFVDPSPVQWPSLRDYAWNLRRELDWKAMEKATRSFVGEHDFKAFCAADSSAKTTVRTIHEARWGKVPIPGSVFTPNEMMALRITGSGFLKQMVRSMVGTIVQVGTGRADFGIVSELLSTGKRSKIGPTAPSRGLWLWDILYT